MGDVAPGQTAAADKAHIDLRDRKYNGLADRLEAQLKGSYVAGDYTVTLTVTDNDGNTDSTAQNVSVPDDSGGDITLSADGYKAKGKHTVDLSWSGNSGIVDVVRDSNVIATLAATESTYTDNTGNKGSASYAYEVCEAGTNDCSNTANVIF